MLDASVSLSISAASLAYSAHLGEYGITVPELIVRGHRRIARDSRRNRHAPQPDRHPPPRSSANCRTRARAIDAVTADAGVDLLLDAEALMQSDGSFRWLAENPNPATKAGDPDEHVAAHPDRVGRWPRAVAQHRHAVPTGVEASRVPCKPVLAFTQSAGRVEPKPAASARSATRRQGSPRGRGTRDARPVRHRRATRARRRDAGGGDGGSSDARSARRDQGDLAGPH